MRSWVHRLASLKITVSLLVLIVVAMASGTIVETFHGPSAAASAVYHASWFRLLLGLFAVNLAASLVDSYPWGLRRVGFVLTHGSMLVILVGAWTTDLRKVEGQLSLWEGEEGSTFVDGDARHALPFSVKLDSFEIDTYPGTDRPAMFRSRVVVSDPRSGRSFPATIQMNQELSYAGYRLFQSSFRRTRDRDQTILAVSRDPGQPVVFLGYLLLVAGMATVLGTRVAERRALSRALPQAPRGATSRKSARRVAALVLAGTAIASAHAQSLSDARDAEALRLLPVQHDGRVMPLDTLARESVWKVTGSRSFRDADPVAVAVGWSTDPAAWANEPIVPVGGDDLSSAIGMPPGTRLSSFVTLTRNERLLRLFAELHRTEESDAPRSPLLRQASALEERLTVLQGFLAATALTIVPNASDESAPWTAPEPRLNVTGLLAHLRSSGADAERLRREVVYNRVRPTRLAWEVLAAATVASILASSARRRWLDAASFVGLLAGFGVMAWGIGARWSIAGRIPASNMYESLLFLGAGVALAALVLAAVLRNRLVVLNATAMSALTMALADLLPIDPFLHPVPPVLSGTVWLAIHVPIIMVSYALLALGVLVAHMQVGVEIGAPHRQDLAERMNDLLYWYIHAGAFLLIVGILTGSVWASSSWGRYWGWDPKEVWSLVAFLAYLAILHGRLEKLVGRSGVAMLSIVAFWTILMTYVGVNFVLASGLHAYGFGSSSVARWLVALASVEALFLGLGVASSRRRRPAAGALPVAR